MLEIEELSLEGVVYFKKATAALNKNPLTFVRGLNLDADPIQPTGNGAGKSLFFSSMPNVFYFSPPLALKKKAKKEILGKGSAISVKFKGNDGSSYNVKQTASKYSVSKDGEDLGLTRIPLAEKFIREVFPIPEVLFYTTCYVSTQKPFPLQNDSDLDRLNHLTEIFRLDNYDRLRAHFAAKLKAVKDNELRLSVLTQKRLATEEKLKAVSAKVDVDALALNKADYERRSKAVLKKSKEEHELLTLIRDLDQLLTTETELDDLRSKYTVKVSPDKYATTLKAERTLVRASERYEAEVVAYNKTIASLKKRLDAIERPSDDLSSIKTKKAEAEASLEELDAERANAQTKDREFKRLTEAVVETKQDAADLGLKDLANHNVDLEADYSSELEELRSSLRLEPLIEHEHLDEKASTCPVCLSDIDLDNIKRVVSAAKKKLPLLKTKIKQVDIVKKYAVARAALKAFVKSYDPDELAKVLKRAAKARSIVEKCDEHIDAYKAIARLEKELESCEKPDKPEKTPKLGLTITELDAELELCYDIQKHLKAKETILANNSSLAQCRSAKAVKKLLVSTKASLKELQAEIAQENESLARLAVKIEGQNTTISEHRLYTKELKELDAEISTNSESIRDKKVLEALVNAYSNKGLKTLVANRICSLIEQNLNHYRSLVFAEPFAFEINASETGLSILVDRGNDKVSDVRNLSGAESNCFRLLFIISILPLIPDDLRTNILVLDEPSSHSDDVTRQIIVERYLPALAEVVPNVYVITPNSEYLEGSSEWIVKKKNGISTLMTMANTVKNMKSRTSKHG